MRERIERIMKNHFEGTKLKKTGLRGFSEKYEIEGIPALTPDKYLEEITSQINLKKKNKNKKVSFSLYCEMGKNKIEKYEKGEGEVNVQNEKVFSLL